MTNCMDRGLVRSTIHALFYIMAFKEEILTIIVSGTHFDAPDALGNRLPDNGRERSVPQSSVKGP